MSADILSINGTLFRVIPEYETAVANILWGLYFLFLILLSKVYEKSYIITKQNCSTLTKNSYLQGQK